MTTEPSAVVEFMPERKLIWTGGMFPILMGRHYFEFVPIEDAKTQVTHGRGIRRVISTVC